MAALSLLIQPGRLKAVVCVKRPIALHKGARGLGEGERRDALVQHVLGHIALQVVPRLEVGPLRGGLPETVDKASTCLS